MMVWLSTFSTFVLLKAISPCEPCLSYRFNTLFSYECFPPLNNLVFRSQNGSNVPVFHNKIAVEYIEKTEE